MTIAEIKKNAETKMGQSIEALKNNLSRIRTGRASPQLLDVIHVEYYGSMYRCRRWRTCRCWMHALSAFSPGKRTCRPRSKRPFVKAIWV